MIRSIVSKALPFVLALLWSAAFAQTTYTSDKPFTCKASGAYPTQYFSQFNCPGIFFYNPDSTVAAEMFIGWPWTIYVPGQFTTNPYSFNYNLTNFTQPVDCTYVRNQPTVCVQDGTFSYNWTARDGSGNPHTGTVSGTWNSRQICGNRCWYYPVLPTQKLIVNM